MKHALIYSTGVQSFPKTKVVYLKKNIEFISYNLELHNCSISFINLGGHKSFLLGHWYTCFELLVMSPLGFKARVDSLICAWLRCVCATCSLRFIFGVTPADLLVDSMAAEPISSMYLQAGIGGAGNWDLSCHRRTLYWLNYAQMFNFNHLKKPRKICVDIAKAYNSWKCSKIRNSATQNLSSQQTPSKHDFITEILGDKPLWNNFISARTKSFSFRAKFIQFFNFLINLVSSDKKARMAI